MELVLKRKYDHINYDGFDIYSIGLNPTTVILHFSNIKTYLSVCESNFSLIIVKDNQLYYAAVDHIATYPIWISDDLVTDSWLEVENRKDRYTVNKLMKIETYLGGGQNVSSKTLYNEVTRLLPNNFYSNNQMVEYRNIGLFHPFDINS